MMWQQRAINRTVVGSSPTREYTKRPQTDKFSCCPTASHSRTFAGLLPQVSADATWVVASVVVALAALGARPRTLRPLVAKEVQSVTLGAGRSGVRSR
jgi:hypothetical protein